MKCEKFLRLAVVGLTAPDKQLPETLLMKLCQDWQQRLPSPDLQCIAPDIHLLESDFLGLRLAQIGQINPSGVRGH